MPCPALQALAASPVDQWSAARSAARARGYRSNMSGGELAVWIAVIVGSVLISAMYWIGRGRNP